MGFAPNGLRLSFSLSLGFVSLFYFKFIYQLPLSSFFPVSSPILIVIPTSPFLDFLPVGICCSAFRPPSYILAFSFICQPFLLYFPLPLFHFHPIPSAGGGFFLFISSRPSSHSSANANFACPWRP